MSDDPEAVARRALIVRDNLAQRLGALIAENLELLIRIAELERPDSTEVE